jgi:hypothetical protein
MLYDLSGVVRRWQIGGRSSNCDEAKFCWRWEILQTWGTRYPDLQKELFDAEKIITWESASQIVVGKLGKPNLENLANLQCHIARDVAPSNWQLLLNKGHSNAPQPDLSAPTSLLYHTNLLYRFCQNTKAIQIQNLSMAPHFCCFMISRCPDIRHTCTTSPTPSPNPKLHPPNLKVWTPFRHCESVKNIAI